MLSHVCVAILFSSQRTCGELFEDFLKIGNGGVWQRMRARRASVLSQKAPFDALRLLRAGYKQFARLAQIPRCAKDAGSG